MGIFGTSTEIYELPEITGLRLGQGKEGGGGGADQCSCSDMSVLVCLRDCHTVFIRSQVAWQAVIIRRLLNDSTNLPKLTIKASWIHCLGGTNCHFGYCIISN